MVCKFFDKKTGSGAIERSKMGMSINEELAEESHKPVIKKCKRRKVYTRFKENKSVIAERFIKTLKVKMYKKMTANNSKSCLSYLNKLTDQHNNA